MRYEKLMLIDDDDDDQELFRMAIRKIDQSLFCEIFDGALAALNYLGERRSLVDLIFLDLNMPVMDGKEFLKNIKRIENLRDIPVIIFSTTSNTQMLAETEALGATGYYTKPHSFEKLVSLLSSILKGS
jgi:CheY-like chemotaxis protein